MPPTIDIKDSEIKAVGNSGGESMDTIELPLLDWESPDTTYTALLISCKDNTGAVHSRTEWLEIMREQFKLPFTIGLPCGKTITCKTLEDIPLEDLPCPCGNPNHWLIKWWEEK